MSKTTYKLIVALMLTFYFQLLTFNSNAQAPNQPGAGNCLGYTANTNSVDVGLLGGWASSSTSTFSAEQWVMFNTLTAGQAVISRYKGSPPAGTFGWLLYMDTPGTLRMLFNNSQILDQAILFPGVVTNRWYHLAFTYNGTTGALYVNGVLIGTTGNPGGAPNGITVALGSYSVFHPSLCVGCNVYSLDGQLDEVRIWNTALTQTQIRNNMCQKLIGTEPGLVGYWRFDETTGNTAFDSSPNGNNGTGF